jgi:hypothetical protein
VKRSAGTAVGLVGGLVFVVWFSFRALTGAAELGGAWAALLTVVGIAGGIGVLFGALVLEAHPSVVTFRTLQRSFPDGTVARIMVTPDCRYGINRLLGLAPGSHVPKYLVVVEHDGLLEFWASGAGRPLLTVGAAEIVNVEVREVAAGYTVRTRVFIEVDLPDGGRVVLPMPVMRNRGMTAFSDTPRAVRQLAAHIGHRE